MIRMGFHLIYVRGGGWRNWTTPPIHELSQTNYVPFRGGDAAHGPMAGGARMLRQCLPVASLRPQAGKGGGGPRGSLEPGGGEGEGGAGRDGPSLLPLLLLLEPVKLHSRFPQELPFHLPAPGACKTASVCLRRLSSPCAPLPPRPTPAGSPRTGAPGARPGSRGLMLPESGRGGHRLRGTGGVRGFLGILGIRPCPVRRFRTVVWSGGGTRVWGWESAEPRRATPWDSAPRYRGLTGDTRGEPDAGENPRTHVGSLGWENSLLDEVGRPL